jgi:uncharacterized protein YjbJ (UPF0337 family)
MSSGPQEAKTGVVEEIKGRAKAAVGALTNDENLTAEGEAQQDKAQAARDAAKREAQAEVNRTQEKAAEGRERAAQERRS